MRIHVEYQPVLNRLLANRKELRAMAVSMADQCLISAASFAVVLMLSRSLEVADVGRYGLFATALMFALGLTQALILTPYKYLNSARYDPSARQGQFLLLAGLVVIQWLILFAVRPALPDLSMEVLLLLAGMLALQQFHELARSDCFARLDPGQALRLDLVTHLTRIALLAAVMASGATTLQWSLLALLGGYLFWPWLVAHRHSAITITAQKLAAQLRASWRYGRYLLAETLAYSLSTYLYLLGSGALLGTESVALLFAAQSVVNVTQVLSMGTATMVLPLGRARLAQGDIKGWRRLMGNSAALIMAPAALLVALICAIPERLLVLLYGEPYVAAAGYLVVLALPMLVQGMNTLLSAALHSVGRPDIGMRAKVLSALFACLWLVPGTLWFGEWGIVIGMAATPLLWFAVYLQAVFAGTLSGSALHDSARGTRGSTLQSVGT